MAVEVSLQQQAEQALRSILERYTAGEAAVVRAFFARPRTDEDYIQAILKQIGREVQVAHRLDQVAQMGADLERGTDRWALQRRLQHSADEIKHHSLLADLAEWLAGRKMTAEELRKYETNAQWDPEVEERYLHNPHLPEASRMVDVSRELQETMSEQMRRGIGTIAEGGGGAAFIEGSRQGGDEFRDRFAKVMAEITEDEMHHGPEQVQHFVSSHIHTEQDLDLAAAGLTRFMAQHLRVRNEIYGNPLSEAELRSYDE